MLMFFQLCPNSGKDTLPLSSISRLLERNYEYYCIIKVQWRCRFVGLYQIIMAVAHSDHIKKEYAFHQPNCSSTLSLGGCGGAGLKSSPWYVRFGKFQEFEGKKGEDTDGQRSSKLTNRRSSNYDAANSDSATQMSWPGKEVLEKANSRRPGISEHGFGRESR
ncbi:hypothetical protein HAX54_015875 [Datura stramonium]|uniref:Uncharacterized protein n=1 Tax=Datura stramonium TaxID=4076 RepID=A0ABS8UJG3_DATST|nr:hypothetical protein [Datura stramonium]